ncbi:MAG: ribonuclease III domain-containing protein [Bacilli bacterium]|nr:ribonuclease III domain-containing protein [Bacilli bacterium]
MSIKADLLNGANLAFIGDAYYELYIREYLLGKGITNQNALHKEAVKYVSASGHNKIIEKILDVFTPEELVVYKRGRNHNYLAVRKNLKMSEYLNSSGFEALIGYLYLTEQKARLEEIMKLAIRTIEDNNE